MEASSIIDHRCQVQVQAGMNGLAVYQEGCHPGVLGVLASKITDLYSRPVIIFIDDTTKSSGQYLKRSGRSVAGVNRFGGHAMAIGLTIKKTQLENFSINFNQQASLHDDFLHKAHGVHVDYPIFKTEKF